MTTAVFEVSSVGLITMIRAFPANAPLEYVTLLLKPMVDKRRRLQGLFEAIIDVEGLDGMFPPVSVENTTMLKRVLSGLADRKEITYSLRRLGVVDSDLDVIVKRLTELNLVKGAVVPVKRRGLYADAVVELWGDETEEHGKYSISLERQGGKYYLIERENEIEIGRTLQQGLIAGRAELRGTVELIEKIDSCNLKLYIQN